MELPQGITALIDQQAAGIRDIDASVFLALYDAVDGICDAMFETAGVPSSDISGLILGMTHEALVERRIKDANS